jgi:hypothetical protein
MANNYQAGNVYLNTKPAEDALKGLGKDGAEAGKKAGSGFADGFSSKLKDLKTGISDSFASLKTGDIQGSIGGLVGSVTSFAGAWGVAGAAILGVGTKIYGLVNDTNNLQKSVQQLTGATGDELTSLTAKIGAISETFDSDFNETLKAANALAKGMGISTEEALKVVEDGFLDGANASGELLAQLTEYPGFFKEAGYNAKEMADFIALSTKEGIFSDKGADLVKEFGLRIREMTPAAKDALKAIGLSGDELQAGLKSGAITQKEALEIVSKQMGKFSEQSSEVGQTIADVFGGPGEDAGVRFIKLLGDTEAALKDVGGAMTDQRRDQEASLKMTEMYNLAIGKLTQYLVPVIAYTKEFIADGLQAMASALQWVINNLDVLSPILVTVTGMIIAQNAALIASKIAMFATAIATKAVTVATWLFSAALQSTGIPAIVLALAALAAGLIYAYKNFEGFRNVVDGVVKTVKEFIAGIAEALGWVDIFGDKAAEEQDKKQKKIREMQKKNYADFRTKLKNVQTKADADALTTELANMKKRQELSKDGYKDLYEKLKAVREKFNKDDKTQAPSPVPPGAKKTLEDYIKELAKLKTEGKENTEVYKSLWEEAKKLYDADKSLTKATDEVKKSFEGLVTTSLILDSVTSKNLFGSAIDNLNKLQAGAKDLKPVLEGLMPPLDDIKISTSEFADDMYNALTFQNFDTSLEFFSTLGDSYDKLSEKQKALGDTVMTLSNTMGDSFADILTGQKAFGKGMAVLLLDMVDMVVNAALAEALARSLSSMESITTSGILGLAKFAVIAGLIKGGVSALKSSIGYEEGGFTGNIPTNQVAGVVHGQEYVANAQLVRKEKGLLTWLDNGGTSYDYFMKNYSNIDKKDGVTINMNSTDMINELKVIKRASIDTAKILRNKNLNVNNKIVVKSDYWR